MKSKKIVIILIVIDFMIMTIICNFINKNIIKEKQIIKEMSSSAQETELNNQINALNGEHTEYMNYIQTGKTSIATALTNEGVATSNEATLETMAENISKVLKEKTKNATATAEDIVKGKTAYVNGELVTGNKIVKAENTIINLGVGTSFDLTSYDGYENFSINNFIVCVQPQTINLYTDNTDGGKIVSNYFIINQPSITYNNTTGNLSISCIGNYGIGKLGYHYQNHNLSCSVYLVI